MWERSDKRCSAEPVAIWRSPVINYPPEWCRLQQSGLCVYLEAGLTQSSRFKHHQFWHPYFWGLWQVVEHVQCIPDLVARPIFAQNKTFCDHVSGSAVSTIETNFELQPPCPMQYHNCRPAPDTGGKIETDKSHCFGVIADPRVALIIMKRTAFFGSDVILQLFEKQKLLDFLCPFLIIILTWIIELETPETSHEIITTPKGVRRGQASEIDKRMKFGKSGWRLETKMKEWKYKVDKVESWFTAATPVISARRGNRSNGKEKDCRDSQLVILPEPHVQMSHCAPPPEPYTPTGKIISRTNKEI